MTLRPSTRRPAVRPRPSPAIAAGVAVGLAATLAAGAARAAPEFSGQVRPEWFEEAANARGPLAQAHALQPALAPLPRSDAALETELRASGHGLAFVGTVRQQRLEGDRWRSHGWVNELYGSTEAGGWQLSAGKRIVGWDVGYAFRPNDVVEQEVRRTLVSVTPDGRPLLMAEHFDASTAWSFVLVNPTQPRAQPGADEPALAARVYQRDGAVDWHGIARVGAHTGASLGGAVAWVASDALELHASLRALARADTLATDAIDAAPQRANPWHTASVAHPVQALVGGTWTNAEQLSLLAEAWWDGTALSDGQWDAWGARNRGLAALAAAPAAPGAPAGAVAGNLAWQASAFSASTNLRRANLFLRASWQHDPWQPSLDVLFTPADRGRVVTGAIGWQGDRLRIDAGLRVYGGPVGAVLAQLPTRRTAYLASTWTF